MKYCKYCDSTKCIDRFAKHHTSYLGVSNKCKDCTNKYNAAYRNNPENKKKASEYKRDRYVSSLNENKMVAVYYLPEEHYIGITNSLKQRMRDHSKRGKIVDGYEVIAYFERGVDAHLLETMFHIRGYRGYSHNNQH